EKRIQELCPAYSASLRYAGKLRTAMTDLDIVETIPIAPGTDGVTRISGTRVTLDTIIAAFREGATPEEIAHQYPSVPLGDIYEVIGYALRHSEIVASYLTRRTS